MLYRFVKGQITSKKVLKEQISNSRKFDDFRKKYIKHSEVFYNSYKQLKENPPEADVYIVGSDQVWNFSIFSTKKEYVYKSVHCYMLDFGDDSIKRMSYAASWSVKSLSQDLIDEIRPLLQKFSYVSVREKLGIELCKQCGYNNAEFVCDPTFLLNAETYRELYINEEISYVSNKYILLYMLNNEYDFDIQKVYDFAKEKELDIVYVTGNGNKKESREQFYATIPEWLYLIDHAEYVVTNSFHCSVFSSIFSKKFGVIRLKGKHMGMNSRFDSLFEFLGINTRYIDESFDELLKDYIISDIKIESCFLEILNA